MGAAPRVAAPGLGAAVRSDDRPVLLATLGVPFDGSASAFAVDSAVESARPLIVVNCVELPPLPMSVNMRYDQLEYTTEMAESLSAVTDLAHSLGVHVERLRVRSPRPVEALLELVADLRPGLLVFGADSRILSRRVRRKAVCAITDKVSCLVWLAD